MPSWWKRVFGGGRDGEPDEPEAPAEQSKVAEWVNDTPFGYPVLDLHSVTGGLMSATKDPTIAERFGRWSVTPLASLDWGALAGAEPVHCELVYSADPDLCDGFLFTPAEMEEKWVLALHEGILLAIRSWTGDVVCRARAVRTDTELRVESLSFAEEASFDLFGDPVQVFDWLIRRHALSQMLPLPVDDDGAKFAQRNPIAVFSVFGRMAFGAATCWDPPAASNPLRADGAIMSAVRGEVDLDEVRRLARSGLCVDSPSPTKGFRPLHIAVVKGDADLIELLLELGADPNGVDANGQAVIGYAVVYDGGPVLLENLVNRGAALDTVNNDGFDLMHAAAEADRGDLIPWLVERGVGLEPRTNHGHTPLQLSAALGKLSALKALLAEGADPLAETDGMSARDIAAAEGQNEAVAALDVWLARQEA